MDRMLGESMQVLQFFLVNDYFQNKMVLDMPDLCGRSPKEQIWHILQLEHSALE